MPAATPPFAAIIRRTDDGIDALVASFAADMLARGWRIRGLLQEVSRDDQGCSVSLRDIAAGSLHPISQDLGACSTACRLDPGGLAEASAAFRQITAEDTDLVIFNRFAGLEAAGEGYRAEMLDIMSRDIPCLTIVPEKHLAAWRLFTGGLALELEARREALEQWFLAP